MTIKRKSKAMPAANIPRAKAVEIRDSWYDR